MKINMTVSNENHAQLVSSLIHNMMDSDFNDVTLVCSDGQLRVNGLTLAMLLPAPYRSLHLGEGALLLLPQHKVQEMWVMVDLEKEEQEDWQAEENVQLQDQHRVQLQEEEIVTEPDIKEVQPNLATKGMAFQGNHTEDNQTQPSKDFDEPIHDMEDSSDDDTDKEEEHEDRRSSMVFITREEHLPQEELANVTARYIAGRGKSSVMMVVNEQFIFWRSNITKRKSKGRINWECAGRRKHGCTARALTHREPIEGVVQLEAGSPVDLIYIWRSHLHKCSYEENKGYIFTMDLQNRMKQCLLENPTMKYQTAFVESKAFLISRIPSKDLRKKLRKESKVSRTWWYRQGNKVRI